MLNCLNIQPTVYRSSMQDTWAVIYDFGAFNSMMDYIVDAWADTYEQHNVEGMAWH